MDLLVNLMRVTSKGIMKAISLLIVSMFLLAQFASASHFHSDVEDAPEPNVCVMCLAATQDDDGDLDIPPSPPTPFVIPNTLDFDLVDISDATFALCREEINVAEPPNLRPWAPRAPPV